MRRMLPALLLLVISSPAFAAEGEHMNLFPNGRAAYQARFDSNAERYEIDKRSYVDNLYEYKGEGGAAAKRQPMMPEADLDAYINGTATLNEVNAEAPTKAPPLPSSVK